MGGVSGDHVGQGSGHRTPGWWRRRLPPPCRPPVARSVLRRSQAPSLPSSARWARPGPRRLSAAGSGPGSGPRRDPRNGAGGGKPGLNEGASMSFPVGRLEPDLPAPAFASPEVSLTGLWENIQHLVKISSSSIFQMLCRLLPSGKPTPAGKKVHASGLFFLLKPSSSLWCSSSHLP